MLRVGHLRRPRRTDQMLHGRADFGKLPDKLRELSKKRKEHWLQEKASALS